jgi:hypothetical protein
MKRATVIGIITTVLGLYEAAAQNSQSPPSNPAPKAAPVADNGVSALRSAAEAKQYLFAFVYEQEDEETRAARKKFEAAVAKVTPASKSVRVDRSLPEEKEMVEKFGLQSAPVPIVLAIAPNGAVTGSIKAGELSEERLQGAVASPRPATDPQGCPGRPSGAGMPAKRPNQGQRCGHERREGDQGG